MPFVLAMLLMTADLRLELVRHSLTGAHYRYREYVGGLPTENYVTSRNPVMQAAASEGGYATALRNVNGRVARRVIRDRIAYDYDAETGAILRTTPLYFHGRPARVFDPNPVASLNDPSLRDGNDAAAAVPDAAYHPVELEDVAASGPLRGPNVSLIDRQAPNTVPPDGSGPLVFDRAADGFEDVNAYFHIDRNQRYLQSLGYAGERSIAAYPIEVDAHGSGGSDESFFLPSLTAIGRGTLIFGEGGTDDAEDADILIHEYGHAILEWIAPGSFAGSFASQARALAEGFGDYWAFSQHAAIRAASGRDPYCFADWDARCPEDDPSQQCAYAPGSDCLRRLDSTHTMADYDTREQSGTEHRNGSIWSSALRELHERAGKRVADTIILESIFDMPPLPTYAAAAHRLVEADQELYGGAHVADICAVMAARGIIADCAFVPRGELTHFQSNDRGVAIPDNDTSGITSSLTIDDTRTIEDLFVRVDIVHPSRGDLRIELIAPDGTTVMLKQTSVEGGHDVRTTFGLTAMSMQPLTVFRGRSAAGVWRLRVIDLRPRDAGTLRSWDLVVKFSGATPSPTRPRGEHAQMIPVVAHLFGAGATEFASDVRIANPRAEATAATLVFTPSGEDGRTSFAAIEVALAAGQTIALDDVVAAAFLTAGSGSLEVLGDVVVMSRTYAVTPRGTMGQQVPSRLDATGLGEPPIYLVALPVTGTRLNFGFTEVGGGTGILRVDDGSQHSEYPVTPFTHVQFAAPFSFARVTVVSGDARVVAYFSEVDNSSGDAMFLPAVRQRADRTVMAPALSAPGANGVAWHSDLWTIVPQPSTPFIFDLSYVTGGETIPAASLDPVEIDVVAQRFGRPGSVGAMISALPAQLLAFSRIATDGMSQFVPFLETDAPTEQNLVFIESDGAYRTNIGFVADAPALAEVIVYDSKGAEVERRMLSTDRGVAQAPVLSRVVNGRALVRFLSGHGHAYASLIDNGTSDATFIQ
jgi:subtilisin-like proprotein convertase family protein